MSDPAPDRRVARTREAIRAAFNGLILARGYDGFSAADIAEAANVGRSTFYEHFQGKDEVLAATLVPVLTPLAEACVSAGPDARVEAMVAHFWENRRMARAMMDGRAMGVMARQLAILIEARLPPGGAIPAPLLAIQIAHGQLALIEEWLSGRHGCSPAQIAAALQATAHATVAANRRGVIHP
jgi:AcrR family transcriptional regulator